VEQIIALIGTYVAIIIEFLKGILGDNPTLVRIVAMILGGIIGLLYQVVNPTSYGFVVMFLLGLIAGFMTTGIYAVVSGLLRKMGTGNK